jgi:pimeloyl-ACP methyl ester carboxylesterase
MMTSSGYQRVNGLRLWVHRFRDESRAPTGLTIVLLHGFMDSGATWDMVAPVLARAGHDVLAPDLRGFGQSDYVGPGGYYHFPDYVADLAELVDAVAPRRLGIVGHSMGGTVAALYAGAHPDRVERLALLEGMGPMGTGPAVAVDRLQAWLRTLREVSRIPKPLTSIQEAVERLSLHHPRVPREVIESRARLLTRADETGRLVWAYDPLHRTTAPTPFSTEAFSEFLRRIDCPTLVVSGGAAGWHPPDEPARVACLAHPVRFELPAAGHMMHWTEPQKLADRLFEFFGEPAATRTRAPVSMQPGSVEEPPSGPIDSHGAPVRAVAPGPAAVPATPAIAAAPVAAAPAPAIAAVPAVAIVGGSAAATTTTTTKAPIPAPAPSGTGLAVGPIYAGAAADLGRVVPAASPSRPGAQPPAPAVTAAPPAGAVPVTPTRPSQGSGGGGG